MERYCFELECVSRDREVGVDAPAWVGMSRSHGAVYVVYDRLRGLYQPYCYVPDVADAQCIVDALNRVVNTRDAV